MINLSSAPNVSYAYLATLSRLDSNGDGVLSRSERAADEKPGIIREFLENGDAADTQSTYPSGVVAWMMGSGDKGSVAGATVPYALQQIAPETEDPATMVYRNTYGEFDAGVAA